MYYFACPNCGSNRRFTFPQEQQSGLGCLILLLGGLLPALLYTSAMSRRVQCNDCGFIFRQPPPPGTAVSNFALAVIGIVVVSCMITSLLLLNPGFPAFFRRSPALLALESAVAENPRAIVAGILPMIILLLLVSFFTSWVSTWRARRELRENFEFEPQPFAGGTDDAPREQ